MIARLTGVPDVSSDTLIVDVQGVGYAVLTTNSTHSWCFGQPLVSLFIYTHVTETNLELFGFRSMAEKQLFLLLISVSGVGPKTALGIINNGTEETVSSIQQANISFFTRAPRVGKKLAQKIIIELSSKLGGITELDLTPLSTEDQQIIEALMALGFDEQLARTELRLIERAPATTIQTTIKELIRKLSQ